MPQFRYQYINVPGDTCGAGPGAGLVTVPPVAVVTLGWAQLLAAQLRLGVYPANWVVAEMDYRIRAFVLGCTTAPTAAYPGLPAVGLPNGTAPNTPLVVGGAADMAPSPVALGMDMTERGQLSYHIGTAIGGAVSLALNGPGQWWPFHLSRAVDSGGVFTFATPDRPDIVTFNINIVGGGANNVFNTFAVWENKGYSRNMGPGTMAAALLQAQSLVSMTMFPASVVGLAATPVPIANRNPQSHVASKVDTYHHRYRIQVRDPTTKTPPPWKLPLTVGDEFLRAYYAPFAEAMFAQKQGGVKKYTHDMRDFSTVPLALGVRLGMPTSIIQTIRKKQKPGVLSDIVAKALGKGFKNDDPDQIFVDGTGIMVQLPEDWRSSVGPEVKTSSRPTTSNINTTIKSNTNTPQVITNTPQVITNTPLINTNPQSQGTSPRTNDQSSIRSMRKRDRSGPSVTSSSKRRKSNQMTVIPTMPTEATIARPARGSEEAAVTIVGFLDLECPFSEQASAIVEQLCEEYGDAVRYVVKHDPRPHHSNARLAAIATEAAAEQGAFWELHGRLLRSHEALDWEEICHEAHELELDLDRLAEDLGRPDLAARVDFDRDMAAALGAEGTPTFFVDGHRIKGVPSIEELRTVIDEALA